MTAQSAASIVWILTISRFTLGEIQRLQDHFTTQDSTRLSGSAFAENSAVGSALRCSALCARHSQCVSFNYAKRLQLCELNRDTSRSDPGKLDADGRFKYYEIMNQKVESLRTEETATKKPHHLDPTSVEPNPTTSVEPTTKTFTTDEPTTGGPTTKELTTTEDTPGNPTAETSLTDEPSTKKEPKTVKATTEEPTTEQPSTKKLTTEELSTEELTTQDPTTEKQTTKEPSTEEQTVGERTTEELTTQKQPTQEPTTKRPTTMEPTTEEPSTKKPTTEELSTEEPTTKVTTEELTTQAPSTSTPSDPTFQTCSALRQAGYTVDGDYMIDPDGSNNGEDAFLVYCEEMATIGWTTINYPDVDHVERVTSDPHDVNIAYYASETQIEALIVASSDCRQRLNSECRNAHLWVGETQLAWWVSSNGTKMPNWGGAPHGTEGCSCYGSCVGGDPTSRCNCGAYANHWHVDGGFLTAKNWLPVRALHFDHAAPPKELYYRLGGLQCS